ncbi:MAG: hypothetical protein E7282_01670 [Lachnospiraceae bacterium]|nr:hypothetical protein [Lachnospiraceae bacterium]
MEKRNYYVDGTSVRELNAAPKRVPTRDPRVIERERKQKNRRNAVRRNRERALSMNFGFVTFLSICVILCAAACVSLVRAQSSATQNLKTITALESQVTDLRTSNDETEKRLNTSVDLNEIKDIAMNQLGMKYASEDQIVYYHVDKTNYMDQYGDIPEN